MSEITLVPPAYVLSIWPKVKDHLQRALDRSEHGNTMPVLLERLMNGAVQLWVAFDQDGDVLCATTTYVSPRLTGNALVISYCGGGRMGEWLPNGIAILERYARDMGCQEILVFGRKGWGKALGWKPGLPSFVKELRHD